MKIFILVMILLCCPIASALEMSDAEIEEHLDDVDLSELPKVLKFILGKPRINIDVDGEVYGFVVAGNRVKDFVKGGLKDPNYVVYLSEEELEEIINSEDISTKLGEMYTKDLIKIEAKNYGGKVKYYLARKFTRWF